MLSELVTPEMLHYSWSSLVRCGAPEHRLMLLLAADAGCSGIIPKLSQGRTRWSLRSAASWLQARHGAGSAEWQRQRQPRRPTWVRTDLKRRRPRPRIWHWRCSRSRRCSRTWCSWFLQALAFSRELKLSYRTPELQDGLTRRRERPRNRRECHGGGVSGYIKIYKKY